MIAYTKTKLTQQERIETDLKRGNYGQNNAIGTYLLLTIDFRG